jgi:hypothetical protein
MVRDCESVSRRDTEVSAASLARATCCVLKRGVYLISVSPASSLNGDTANCAIEISMEGEVGELEFTEFPERVLSKDDGIETLGGGAEFRTSVGRVTEELAQGFMAFDIFTVTELPLDMEDPVSVATPCTASCTEP